MDVEIEAPNGPTDPVVKEPIRSSAAPIRMTSSRGIPLRLAKLEIGGVLEDPLAFTELRMVFENPEPKSLTGELEIELPVGAKVTRFASRDGDVWREAEVLERKAPVSVESLQVRTDPQLNDGVAGQVFRATIPNIEGRARQEVVISYAEAFDQAGDEYRVRLRGLAKVPKLTANVLITETWDDPSTSPDERGTKDVIELDRSGQLNEEDLVVQLSAERQTGVRHGKMVVARVNPLSHDHRDPMHGLTVLFDTSASRAVDFEEQVGRLEALLDSITRFEGGHLPVRVVAFDQAYRVTYEGPIGDFGPQDARRLRERKPLGASNLEAAIEFVGAHQQVGFNRVLLLSDGVATAGRTERASLEAAVNRLQDVGVVRFDVVTDGTLANRRVLERISTALPRHGLVLDAATDSEELTRRLARTVTERCSDRRAGRQMALPRAPRRGAVLGRGVGVRGDRSRPEPGDSLQQRARQGPGPRGAADARGAEPRRARVDGGAGGFPGQHPGALGRPVARDPTQVLGAHRPALDPTPRAQRLDDPARAPTRGRLEPRQRHPRVRSPRGTDPAP